MTATQETRPPAAADMSARLSDGQVNTIYRHAYDLAERGRHDQACALFGLLTMYRPKSPKYTHAVGVCMRKMGRHEDAIRMFARTVELNPKDCGPAIQVAECLLLLGQRGKAVEVLGTVVAVARACSDAASLERAVGMIELVEAGEHEAAAA